jgi:hypothetical protein
VAPAGQVSVFQLILIHLAPRGRIGSTPLHSPNVAWRGSLNPITMLKGLLGIRWNFCCYGRMSRQEITTVGLFFNVYDPFYALNDPHGVIDGSQPGTRRMSWFILKSTLVQALFPLFL